MAKTKLSDREIEEIYENGTFRLSQERNDFLLPQIVDFIEKDQWINIRPEYQRRLVWDNPKKSLLIESLLMNVPIPPIFLFEWDYNRYEVMDGQQRLNSIMEFYNNEFKLTGLDKWAVLNGRRFSDLPSLIQRGLNRRRVSATVLLAESSTTSVTQDDIRRIVFERLNTAGKNLNNQELRNCLYSGSFNKLLIKLAGNRLYNEILGIPPYEDNITDGKISRALKNNRYYKRMEDVEVVLRYFAFRNEDNLRGSVSSILDNTMKKNQQISAEEAGILQSNFESRLQLAFDIFGYDAFKLKNKSGRFNFSKPLFDGMMVALDKEFDKATSLVQKKKVIYDNLYASLGEENFYELVVGRGNTADKIKERITVLRNLLIDSIA